MIENHGTFIHPHGEVKRSIVFTHEGATPRRMMINLSDTHVSVANLVDIATRPQESEIEVAPYYNQIYRFGDYLVEQVQGKPENWGNPNQDLATFRVKKAGGDLENAPVLAKFDVGQVYRVLKHNDSSLVLFRQLQDRQHAEARHLLPPTTEALVVDMRNPAAPAAGRQGQGPHDERGLLPLLVRHGRLLRRLLVRPGEQLRHHRARPGLLHQRVAATRVRTRRASS